MNAPVSVMIVVRMHVAMSGVIVHVERVQQPQHARPGRRLGREDVVQRAEVRVPQMMVDVEHVRALDLRQKLPGAREVAHVAEHPQRIGRQIRRHLARDELASGKKRRLRGTGSC
jgi:hypothetical protein